MKCMYCGASDSRVMDSRPTDEGAVIRRRRECIKCGKRFTTYEKIETVPLMVVKRDGSRQLFDIEKIRVGIIKACEKCKVSADQIEKLVMEIDNQVHNSGDLEVSSLVIGELISDGLRKLDPVAYIRFSSVYRELNDLNKLMEEMNKLIKKDNL
ncbi:MAG: transcriptional repressor NrdR [Clostridia bacterium]|nr:transcriptional repressor NrdR [Clostridia bacterium]